MEEAGLLAAADPGVGVQHRPHQGRPRPGQYHRLVARGKVSDGERGDTWGEG